MLTKAQIKKAAILFNEWLDVRDRRDVLNDHTNSNDAALLAADQIEKTLGGDRLLVAIEVCKAAKRLYKQSQRKAQQARMEEDFGNLPRKEKS